MDEKNALSTVRFMAEGLLHTKADMEPLGINWPQKFLARHPQLKTRYIRQRACFGRRFYDFTSIFELFRFLSIDHNVQEENIYKYE